METTNQKSRMGILVGGGPAPGINGVISAATIKAELNGLEVIGIYDGFRWLIKQDKSHIETLTIGKVSRIHFDGGSILRTRRDSLFNEDGKVLSGPAPSPLPKIPISVKNGNIYLG